MVWSMHDWVAATGLRRVDPDATHTPVDTGVLNDASLSLEAKGLYVLLQSYQGQPIDPYADAVEDDETIARAVEELIARGYAARVDHEFG